MVKVIRAFAIIFLLVMFVRICSSQTNEKIDYSANVKLHYGIIERLYDDTYETMITFNNITNSSIDDISCRFYIYGPGEKELMSIQRDILPAGYSLPPGAGYPYKFIFTVSPTPAWVEAKIIYAK